MKRAAILLAWGALAIAAALAVLNWPTLMAPATLDLVVAHLEAPLGVVLLGLALFLVTLFYVAYVRQRIASLMESRRLHRELQRVQDLADKAESSRIENLHQLVATEFRLLNARLAAAPSPSPPRLSEEPVGASPPALARNL